jgi:hypothetical protein
MKNKILIISLVVLILLVAGYIGSTYKQYGQFSRDTDCGQEFALLFEQGVVSGDISVCTQSITLNSYKTYRYDIKNGWGWSPRYCKIESYPTLLFRVNEEERTLEKEGLTGVYTCTTYITEQVILRNNTDKTLGLIALYSYRMNELENPSSAREALRDIMKLNTSSAQEFLISQAKNKSLDSYTRTSIVVSLPKYVEQGVVEAALTNILLDVENDPLLRFRAAETLVSISGSKYLSEIKTFEAQTSDTYLKEKIHNLIIDLS